MAQAACTQEPCRGRLTLLCVVRWCGCSRILQPVGGNDVAPKAMRRNMPDPLPILLLGRLAIDKHYHNHGFGSALLRDALLRAVAVARDAGVFAILLHAISPEAKQFYLSRGFVQSPLQPMTLMMTLETVRVVLGEPT